jgi:hypothetical protein
MARGATAAAAALPLLSSGLARALFGMCRPRTEAEALNRLREVNVLAGAPKKPRIRAHTPFLHDHVVQMDEARIKAG